MTVIPIRPLGVAESEAKRNASRAALQRPLPASTTPFGAEPAGTLRRAGGVGTGKPTSGTAATPSVVVPSPASSTIDLASRVAQLQQDLAHLALVVDIQAEILLRLTTPKKPQGAA